MPAVPFQNVPSTLRSPLFYAEVNNSAANTAQSPKRALIIAQKTTSGQATANQPAVAVANNGVFQGGAGSQLDLMIQAYRQNDNFGELWVLPLADDGSATAAAGAFVFTGPATAGGTLYAYVGDVLITVAVTSGMTATQAATALFNAINANTSLPVVATNAVAGTTAITAKNGGAVGNDIQLGFNLLGYPGGQAMPAGLTVAITPMAAGAVNPTLTTGLANLGDQPFDFIITPYTDSTSLAAIAAFLNDTVGRWSWDSQVYGHHFTAYRGTYSANTTLGTGLNDQHLTVMGVSGSASPMMKWAAAIGAQVAVSVRADPAQPLQTLVLNGLMAPPVASRFTLSQREALLYDGISTFTVNQAGAISISRLITTYQQNAFSQPDNSYLAVETMMTLVEVLRAMAIAVTSKFSRSKLAADGTRFAPGSNIVTPSIIAAFIVATYRQLEYNGLVQGSDIFAANLIVVQNASNPNRVDVLWPAILIDQLNVFALLAQFRLSTNQFPGANAASAGVP
jgi:phage tail sheath gpL-like